MKKAIIALIFILAFSAGISGEPMDLVLLLDTSASMSDSYRETSDYLIGPFLREFLRIGDTFHLISFSGSPRLEISRRVEGIGDVEAIIGRLLLMYPLEPESNIADALSFAENFTSSLSGTRPKKLILLSDGNADGSTGGDVQSLVDQASERLRRQGADLQFIKSPVTGNGPSSGRPPEYISQPTTTIPPTTAPPATTVPPATTTPPPAVTTAPPATTTTPPAATTTPPPATTTEPLTETTPPPVTTTTPPTITEPPAATSEPPTETTPPPATTTTPSTITEPPAVTTTTPPVTTTAPATTTPTSQTGITAPTTTAPESQTQAGESSSRTGFGIPLHLLILILLNLLALGLIAYFVVKNLHKSPDRAVARAAVPQGKKPGQSSGIITDGKNTSGIYTNNNPETRKPHASPHPEPSPPKASPQPEPSPPKASPHPVSPPPKASPLPEPTPPKASPLPEPSSPLKASPLPVSSPPKRKPLPKDKDYEESSEDSLMLNLFVEDQNTAIGRRNIHLVKTGNKFSIGGGKSDFLIFLVPIPPYIAELQYDGKNCTLTLKKSQYFPDLGSQQVPNCIGKNIRVVSDKNYELYIRIEKYEDPLKAFNRLMNSISVPGEKGDPGIGRGSPYSLIPLVKI